MDSAMKRIDGDKLAIFDVDDTLILFDESHTYGDDENARTIMLTRPDGTDAEFRVNEEIVQILIEHKTRGHTIMVWSAGGVDWAELAIRKLGIEHAVDGYMCKPTWFYDDQPIENLGKTRWLGNPDWLKRKTFYHP